MASGFGKEKAIVYFADHNVTMWIKTADCKLVINNLIFQMS